MSLSFTIMTPDCKQTIDLSLKFSDKSRLFKTLAAAGYLKYCVPVTRAPFIYGDPLLFDKYTFASLLPRVNGALCRCTARENTDFAEVAV